MSLPPFVAPWFEAEKVPLAAQVVESENKDAPLPKLFTPLKLRDLTLKNRIVVPPMCMYSCKDGVMNDFHLSHYGSFARGGAGLVIFEMTNVQPNGRISVNCSGIWNDEQAQALKRVVQFVKSQGAAAGIQIAHAGRKSSMLPGFVNGGGLASKEQGGWPDDIVAPSALAFDEVHGTPRALTKDEIKTLIADFVKATERCVEAGFDFVELHGAHGYLINEFLSPLSNHRDDEYGGSLENRMRFALELATAVRAAWPKEKPLGFRLSAVEWVEGGWSESDTAELCKRLLDIGVDLIDVSTGGNSPKQTVALFECIRPGYQVPFAANLKKSVPAIAVSAVGIIVEPKQAESILSDDQADLVMLGREFLRDPNWPLRAARELGIKVSPPPQYSIAHRRRR